MINRDRVDSSLEQPEYSPLIWYHFWNKRLTMMVSFKVSPPNMWSKYTVFQLKPYGLYNTVALHQGPYTFPGPYTFYESGFKDRILEFSLTVSGFQGTIWYFSDLFDSLIRLLTVLTDPVMFPTSINGNLTKIDIYNKKVIEGFMLEYKQSFHSALLWVKLREKIAQFLRKESTKSSPGITNFIFQVG